MPRTPRVPKGAATPRIGAAPRMPAPRTAAPRQATPRVPRPPALGLGATPPPMAPRTPRLPRMPGIGP